VPDIGGVVVPDLRRGPRNRGNRIVRKNDPFSELSAGRAFRSETGPLAVRNTRFEKQSSIYSRQMSKLNSFARSLPASMVWLSFAEKEFEPDFEIVLSEDLFDRPLF
jgi:hypothetical protein